MNNIIVVVSALGTQGASVISACLSSPDLSNYKIRALTSNPTCDAATSLAASNFRITIHRTDLNSLDSVTEAFENATLIFANTAFDPQTFIAKGPTAAQSREESQGLNIARAAAQIPSLKHLIWSTLVDTNSITNGKIVTPHFQSKIPAEKYLRDPENGMAERTTFLHVGLYASVFQRMPYTPIFVVSYSPSFLVSVFEYHGNSLTCHCIIFQKEAQKFIITLPCATQTKIAFVGDETLNIGLIAHAIFTTPYLSLTDGTLFSDPYAPRQVYIQY